MSPAVEGIKIPLVDAVAANVVAAHNALQFVPSRDPWMVTVPVCADGFTYAVKFEYPPRRSQESPVTCAAVDEAVRARIAAPTKLLGTRCVAMPTNVLRGTRAHLPTQDR